MENDFFQNDLFELRTRLAMTDTFFAPVETESDVEQKIIYPLLTRGLHYPEESILTKEYLAPTKIDKGAKRKAGYYPDYMVHAAGLPVLVLEAKGPEEPVEDGWRDIRLYSMEVNKRYRGVNPLIPNASDKTII